MQLDGVPDIRVTELTKRYGEVTAVDAIDLEIDHGEFFTLLGPSGSGKTTTLRMVAGFEAPDEGTIELAGADVSRLPPYERPVNTVFQDYALFPHMTVAENIEYGLKVHRVPKAERTASASRFSSRAVSASASRSPAHSSTSRASCSSTSRSARST